MSVIIIYLLIGLLVGAISGLVGIGGGIILVPIFVYLFGLSQHEAQGTTLALFVPPIGILAAWTYYKHGYVNLTIAALVCLGFFFGSLFGAKLAVSLPTEILRKIFGFAIILAGIYTVIKK